MRKNLPVTRRLPLLLVVSAFAIASPARSDAPSTVIRHSAGVTTVERTADADHVVVNDVQGNVVSESYCEPNTFDSYRAVFAQAQEALAKKDRAAVAKLFAYPLRVNAPKPISLRNEAALLKSYDKVFTPAVLEAVGAAEPAAVFCRNGEGMLGDGVFWATMSEKGARLSSINP